MTFEVNDVEPDLLRSLAPGVLSVLVRRGADFATAEDAVQEALVRALAVWPDDPPRDPKAWLITTAWHAFIDLARSDSSRRAREERFDAEPEPGQVAETKDLIAGWMIIDVDSEDRAIELAGELSAAPGAGGKPIHEWLEVRPFLNYAPTITE